MSADLSATILSVTVGTEDMLRAFGAVLPHASKRAEHAHAYRLRCHLDPAAITVTASDGYSAAAARVAVIVPADETSDPHARHIDLSPADVAKVLAVFKVKKKDDVDTQALLQLRLVVEMHPVENTDDTADGDRPDYEQLERPGLTVVAESTAPDPDAEPDLAPVFYVHFADVSGMIPGETLELPMLPPHDHAPNVPRMISRELAVEGSVESFGISPDLITRFTAAAKAYGSNLIASVADDEAAMVVVRCGEDFIGAAHPERYSDLSKAAQRDWLLAWREQFQFVPDET
ncbi:hypothetical protein [Gordonia sihwensis]|uniref:hypothetical protein n=1 Tax=Gordonia sihwensis TaxID=173559 RepID=UPI002415B3D5|nr:hypothetical protein [Gordonia sihwensis]WFN93445.1 hypothetical protein P5P27_02405 [Gordonia sihwensis]